MSDWKVQAKQHFANSRSPEKLREIKVPEWGISVFYWPAVSLAEDRATKLGYQAGADPDEQSRNIRVDSIGGRVAELIARGRDQHGRNLWGESEFDAILTGYDPGVIERIVAQMETEYSTVEDAEKN